MCYNGFLFRCGRMLSLLFITALVTRFRLLRWWSRAFAHLRRPLTGGIVSCWAAAVPNPNKIVIPARTHLFLHISFLSLAVHLLFGKPGSAAKLRENPSIARNTS